MPRVMMHVTYRPRKGKERQLLALIKKHWPALDKAGLATKDPAIIYRATDKRSGQVYFIEVFSWKDDQASTTAHQTPEVLAIWDPMGPLLESLELAMIEPL